VLSRTLIRSARWESFSSLLEMSYAQDAALLASKKIATTSENAFEEGD
jgi:hypothetical protein